MSRPILVVEDEPIICSMVQSALERAGHVVLTASSGAEMFARLETVDPGLIVLDLGLPDGDALPYITRGCPR